MKIMIFTRKESMKNNYNMYVKKSFLLVPFAALLLLNLALAQQKAGQIAQGEPIFLRYADSLLGENTSGEIIRKYSGRVSFTQGNVVVNCDNAVHYIERNEVRLSGNVVITQEGLVLRSPLVNYSGNSGIANAFLGVKIENNNALLVADSGTYSTQTRIADFQGKVRFDDDTVKITCNRMRYFKIENISNAYGNVVVDDDSATVHCDTLEYFRNTHDSKAFHNVRIIGKYDRTFLIADTVLNISSKGFTEASGNPVLFQIDSTKKNEVDNSFTFIYDTLSISSDTMRVSKAVSTDSLQKTNTANENSYLFIGDVELRKGGIAAKSGFGDYRKSDGYFRLDAEPVTWYDSTQLSADTIIVYIPKNKLKEIYADGNAFASMVDDTLNANRINQISGGKIRILFNNDSIVAIKGYENAKSLYYMTSEKGADGAARNSADSIFIQFTEGEADEILWLGGVQGEYFPEIIIYGDPKSYFLPGFKREYVLPKKRYIP